MYHFKVKAPMGSQAFAHAQRPILHIYIYMYELMVQQEEQHGWDGME